MQESAFSTDSYEDQLAMVLLEILYKKDVLASKTYSTVRKILNEQEDTIVVAIKPTSPNSI